jgi:hypothetical protein
MNKTTTAEFWSPQRVQHFHDYVQRGLPQGIFLTYRRSYIRNISYAFQYMEYLTVAMQSQLHPAITSQLRKTFIITACGAIESMLWMLLKGRGLQKQDQWEELQSRETNPFSDDGAQFKFEVRYYRKRGTPIDVEMRFCDMCRRAEKRHVLGVGTDVYEKLNHLRGLRNRVHLQSVQHDRDNDWWSFTLQDVETMKDVLRQILRSNIFDPFPHYSELFDWLTPPVGNITQATAT